MALPKQTMGVPLKGLNTVADPKSANVGEFDLIENMFFNRTARGGGELRKRYGGAALSRTAYNGAFPLTSGTRLATYDNERLMVGSTGQDSDPGSVWSYSPLMAGWKQARIANINFGQGAMPPIGLTSEIIASSPINYAAMDVAVNAARTVMAVVWKDIDGSATSDDTYISTIDLVTGHKILTGVPLSDAVGAAGWIRVVALSTVFMVFIGSTAGNINAWSLPYATPQGPFTGPTLVAANMNATCKAAITRNGSNDSALVAYHSTVPDTKILIWNSNMTSGGATASAEIPSQALGWVDWDYSDGNGYLAFVSAATGAKVFTVNQAGPAIFATTTMDATVTSAANVTGYKSTSGPRYHVFIEVRAAATYNCLIRRWPGSGGTTFVFQRSVGLAANCFMVPSTGRYYLMATYDSTLQSGYYLIEVTNISIFEQGEPIVASSLYGLGGGLTITGCLPSAASIATSLMGLPALKLVQSPAGRKIFASCLLKVDFAAASLSGAKRVGEDLHMSGGSTRIYDGTFCTELGFYVFPEVPSLAQTIGGSLTVLGSYQYAVVYAWPDSKGQWHRSAPSPIASITLTGANNQVNLTIPTLRLSRKDDSGGNWGNSVVFIEIYRTVASGTTFYRVNGAAVPPLLSTNGANTVVQADTSSDATVSANDVLYTTGKVLPRIGPPSARLMETWRNRLFLAGTENPNELWVSNEYSFGLGGVSFSDALVIQMESEGGPITALCEMDDRLVIFKRNSIYVLTGNGPTLTGDNQYQQPTRLTATIGSVEQRGVVKTRDGVMFKSTRGIYLLGHGGQIVYAGAGVDTYNSLTVTGSCVLEDEEQVRFVTAEGRTLVYHYGFPDEQGIGEWTTFTNQAAVDCIVWNGKFVHLRSDGTVVEETVGAYTDPSSTSINAKVRLAWLSLTQFFGRFKLYGLSLLGDMMASFTLTHRIAYDYDATVAETETKAVTVATLPPLQLDPARRRATAVQVTLEETSTTQGFTVSGWGLEVGVEDGAFKAGAEKFLT